MLHAIALILAALPFPQERPKPKERKPPQEAPPDTPPEKTPAELAGEVAEGNRERAEEASLALTAVETELAEVWLARRPSLARRRGLPPRDLGELKLSVNARREWERALSGVRDDLERVDWADLDFVRRTDRDWYAALLGTELGGQRRRSPERWNPSFYLREINAVLAGVSRAAELSPDRRLLAVTAHLKRLPELLAAARLDIGTPPAFAARHAQRLADELVTLLDDVLTKRLATGAPKPELWRDYQTARDGAREAAVELRGWLGEAAERNARAAPIGIDTWSALMRDVTGAEIDVPKLKIRVLRDVGELGRVLGPGPADDLPPPPVDAEALAAQARTTLAEGWDLARLLALVETDMPPPWLGAEVAAGPPGVPLASAWMVAPNRPTRAWLTLIVDGATWTAAEKARRARELEPAALRARVLRYGYPGELLWEAWSRDHAQPGYRAVWNEVLRGAWGLYAADLCVRVRPPENPLARDGALQREVARDRLLEAARCYAALLVYAEGASEAEAARELAALAGLDDDAAAYEARELVMDPLRGAAYLGYCELRDLEAVLARTVDAELAPHWVGHLIRRAPSAPPKVHVEDLVEITAAAETPEQDR